MLPISLGEMGGPPRVGRANHAAGLLLAVRPFLQEIWTALQDASSKDPPSTTVWHKQIAHSLSWLDAFFIHDSALPNRPSIARTFHLEDYRMEGDAVTIGVDASPFRLGGWQAVDGKIVAFFSDQSTQLV